MNILIRLSRIIASVLLPIGTLVLVEFVIIFYTDGFSPVGVTSDPNANLIFDLGAVMIILLFFVIPVGVLIFVHRPIKKLSINQGTNVAVKNLKYFLPSIILVVSLIILGILAFGFLTLLVDGLFHGG